MLEYDVVIFKSQAIRYELSKNNIKNKSWKVRVFYELLSGEELKYNNRIKQRAIELRKFNIKDLDSIHLAIAEWYNLDVFITTDKQLINAAKRAKVGIKVMNPIEFWEVLKDE